MAMRDLMARRQGPREAARSERADTPLELLHREVDRLFDDFVRGFELPSLRSELRERRIVPDVDVVESDKDIRLSAELPGVEEKDIEVTLAEGVLRIRGEKKVEEEEKGKDYLRVERAYGRFERALAMPAGIDEDNVRATFRNGVLTVTVPKKAEAGPSARRIDIRAA